MDEAKLRELLIKAFDEGFGISSEGYNNEYWSGSFEDEMMLDIKKTRKYQDLRNDYINEIIKEK